MNLTRANNSDLLADEVSRIRQTWPQTLGRERHKRADKSRIISRKNEIRVEKERI